LDEMMGTNYYQTAVGCTQDTVGYLYNGSQLISSLYTTQSQNIITCDFYRTAISTMERIFNLIASNKARIDVLEDEIADLKQKRASSDSRRLTPYLLHQFAASEPAAKV
jgi:hypothetical protein